MGIGVGKFKNRQNHEISQLQPNFLTFHIPFSDYHHKPQ